MIVKSPHGEPGTVVVSSPEGSIQLWHSKKGVVMQVYGRNGGRKGDAMTFPFDDVVSALSYLLTHNQGLKESARFETEY